MRGACTSEASVHRTRCGRERAQDVDKTQVKSGRETGAAETQAMSTRSGGRKTRHGGAQGYDAGSSIGGMHE